MDTDNGKVTNNRPQNSLDTDVDENDQNETNGRGEGLRNGRNRGKESVAYKRKIYLNNKSGGADTQTSVTDSNPRVEAGLEHQTETTASPNLAGSGKRIDAAANVQCGVDRKQEADNLWGILRLLPVDGTTWDTVVRFLCQPTDPALLGVCRVLFGLLMMIDTIEERGMSTADIRFGDPTQCQFPLINLLQPLPLQWMYIVYMALLIASTGIMLGLAYRVCCPVFMCCYWYILLLDKTRWNNHSYLFGIFSLLFTITDANRYWSLDALINPRIRNTHVPKWNYILFRAQASGFLLIKQSSLKNYDQSFCIRENIFLVYFIAGLKKLDLDWVMGYSMMDLSHHWVFTPFKYFLTPTQVDVFIVHLGGLVIDLFVGFLLLHEKLRPVGLLISSTFHLMNSQMFSIGMFPYGMLTMQLIFCNQDLPRRLFSSIPPSLRMFIPDSTADDCLPSYHCVYTKDHIKSDTFVGCSGLDVQLPTSQPNKRHKLVSAFTLGFIAWQCFLPYSHGITKGYNSWTNGMYGYSWDMMVHSWDIQHIRVTFKDKDTNQSGYLDPMVWSHGSGRWSGHVDMIKQYAHCIERNLKAYNINNVELYFDIWRSLNQRFQQRIVDPRVDVLQAEWNPFKTVSWLMPLIVNKTQWRQKMYDLDDSMNQNRTEVNYTTTVFVADFPGLNLENYVHKDFDNTSLHVLEGQVIVERIDIEKNLTLAAGEHTQIPADTYHKVHTVSSIPSSYMYTFVNSSDIKFMERLAKFQDDLAKSDTENKSLVVNQTLEKYSQDPYLPHYKNVLLQAKLVEDGKDKGSLLDSFKSFLYMKYKIFRRSLRLGYGSVYCLVTNSSFYDYLNSTYIKETLKNS
ncbi:vitamin K-dependent gamma-carboxylase-like [Elysia marginata]|uniref:Vitamin K-dependent gamma-carboxylase-like n=1 Tax=Elysia marginata TaxID=1093978 RepID=A0AAV4HM36_9GAST|nr:vitamin K-dependent gamma-carboxylase-like [Elysia marginata]